MTKKEYLESDLFITDLVEAFLDYYKYQEKRFIKRLHTMTAQERFNKRMARRKRAAKNLQPLMNGLAKSIKTMREELPTIKRIYK
jgi:hypothetical protein